MKLLNDYPPNQDSIGRCYRFEKDGEEVIVRITHFHANNGITSEYVKPSWRAGETYTWSLNCLDDYDGDPSIWIEEVPCAECEGLAMPDDYLCQSCRR